MTGRSTNEALQAPATETAEKRGRRRQRVLFAGKVRFGGGYIGDCIIKDISERGARVNIAAAVGIADEVDLLILRDGLVVRCRRIWSRPPSFGLEFIEATDIRESASARNEPLRAAWLEWEARQPSGSPHG